MVLHRYVLALHVAGFIEALAERGGKGRIRCSGIGESDHRHRRLLRARRERPRCRAAEQREEGASPHGPQFAYLTLVCTVTFNPGRSRYVGLGNSAKISIICVSRLNSLLPVTILPRCANLSPFGSISDISRCWFA